MTAERMEIDEAGLHAAIRAHWADRRSPDAAMRAAIRAYLAHTVSEAGEVERLKAELKSEKDSHVRTLTKLGIVCGNLRDDEVEVAKLREVLEKANRYINWPDPRDDEGIALKEQIRACLAHTEAAAIPSESDEAKAMRDFAITSYDVMQARAEAAEAEVAKLREALEEARRFALAAIRHGVELSDFDPTEHVLIKKIDAALGGSSG